MSDPDDPRAVAAFAEQLAQAGRCFFWLDYARKENWWSCRGAAPRVRNAGPAFSPGSASTLSWAPALLEAGISSAAAPKFSDGSQGNFPVLAGHFWRLPSGGRRPLGYRR